MSKSGKGLRVFNYFILALVAFSFFTSCKKGDPLGANVLPASDILSGYFSDTTTVVTSLNIKDSMVADNLSINMVGSYNDPVFGMTKASCYTQVILPGNTTFLGFGGINPTLDSIILVLPYNVNAANYYGTLTPQTFTVDTLINQITTPKVYYSDTDIAHGTKHLAVITTTPAPNTSVNINYSYAYSSINGTYSPQLRLKLPVAFGQYLINQLDANPYYGQSSAAFQGLLKGFYISVSNPLQLPGQGAILYFNLFLSGAGLQFFYKTTVGAAIDTAWAGFQLGPGAAAFDHFDHDYTSTAFYVPGKDSIVSPTNLYVQAMAGVKTQLSFPYLKNWNKKNPVVINKAELDIPVNSTATGSGTPSSQLYVVRDSAGYKLPIPDEFVNPTYYGGSYDMVNNQYSFNITRYVQQILDGKLANTGLYLFDPSAITANGEVLRGPVQAPNVPRMRLRIFYTPLSH